MNVPTVLSGHRIHVEDIPVLSDRRYVRIKILEYPYTIRAGHVVRYEPTPPRITTAQTYHPTAEFITCSYDEVLIIPNPVLQVSPADRWLVNSISCYEIILTSFRQE